MIDQLGRTIKYLRLSITERCTLKCAYCRADEGLCPKESELSAAEFERIARVFAQLGVNKIRVTGGEPLLRRDVLEIITRLHAVPGIKEITMTTNAQQLPGQAAALKAAGLSRINISIDSLKPERYKSITGGGDLSKVLCGVREAIDAGLLPLKLNTVLLRGINDDEIDDFIDLAKDKPLDIRFIELMPMASTDTGKRVSTDEILSARPWLRPLPPRYPGQPATDYTVEGYRGRIGFISPISHQFCGDCNRVRLMSNGTLRPCLGNNSEVSLLEALKREDDSLLHSVISDAIYYKPKGHAFTKYTYLSNKSMHRIGG